MSLGGLLMATLLQNACLPQKRNRESGESSEFSRGEIRGTSLIKGIPLIRQIREIRGDLPFSLSIQGNWSENWDILSQKMRANVSQCALLRI